MARGARRALAQPLHIVRDGDVAAQLQHAERRPLLFVTSLVRASLRNRRQQQHAQDHNNEVQDTHLDWI